MVVVSGFCLIVEYVCEQVVSGHGLAVVRDADFTGQVYPEGGLTLWVTL